MGRVVSWKNYIKGKLLLMPIIIEVHILRWSFRKTDICKCKKIIIESSHFLYDTSVLFHLVYKLVYWYLIHIERALIMVAV